MPTRTDTKARAHTGHPPEMPAHRSAAAADARVYDRIIIGGGAAGLYCAALCPAGRGLILEKTVSCGQKLLLSGSGRCNLTHGGSIKDFITHYGGHGPQIRAALYRGSNQALKAFYEKNGLPLTEREDGKVFPASYSAGQIRDLLLRLSRANGWNICTGHPVTELMPLADGRFLVRTNAQTFLARQVVVASGGASYPATGSDGNLFSVLEALGLDMVPLRPSLVPLHVQDYPYSQLAGISFAHAAVQIINRQTGQSGQAAQPRQTDQPKRKKQTGRRVPERTGGLLLTHRSFSGPAVLDLSRYAAPGDTLKISYISPPAAAAPAITALFQQRPGHRRITGDKRQAITFFAEELHLPKRFMDTLFQRAQRRCPSIDAGRKAVSLSAVEIDTILQLLTADTFSISGTSGFAAAMATAGGVSLNSVNTKNFACKEHPHLYIIGEALDVDGDTGGYNLQFAFTSALAAAADMAE